MAGWIKCSERMPDREGNYLTLATVTIGGKTYGDIRATEYVNDLTKCDSHIFPDSHRPAFIETDENGWIIEHMASYWMEMPKMPEGVMAL